MRLRHRPSLYRVTRRRLHRKPLVEPSAPSESFPILSEPFPLEELPVDFYSFVVEKMTFQDFKKFNLVSKIAAEMCDDLKEVKLTVGSIVLSQRRERYHKSSRFSRGYRLSKVPLYVRFHAATLVLEKKSFKAIRKYKISADCVQFRVESASDPEFIKQVLQIMRPKTTYLYYPSPEILALKELNELEDVFIRPWDTFNDFNLLDINLDTFSLGVAWSFLARNEITLEGILRFLHKWKDGKRAIKNVRIHLSNMEYLDVDKIQSEFFGHREEKQRKRLVLCKGDGRTDCVVDARERNTVTLSERNCQHNN